MSRRQGVEVVLGILSFFALVAMTTTTACFCLRSAIFTSSPRRTRMLKSRYFGVTGTRALYPASFPHAQRFSTAVRGQNTTSTMNIESSNSGSLLTRTMVRRMKVQDLREELEIRGVAETVKQNRTQLVALLLDQITSSNDADDESCRSKADVNERQERHVNIDNSSTLQEQSVAAVDTTENDRVARYSSNNSTEMDPSRTYILRPACMSGETNGSGIGLVLRDVESDRVVWTAHQYFPAKRSLYEASYTALVFALRCAVHCLRLPNLRVQIDQSLVLNQMVGIYRVEKETLKPLRDEAQRLKEDGVGRNCSLELIPKTQNAESEALARKALDTETSTELMHNDDDDDDDDDETTLLLCTDPMGKDYTGPATQSSQNVHDASQPDSTWSLFAAGVDNVAEESSPSPTDAPLPTAIDPSKEYCLQFDGGARGNPGIAGAGMALFDESGKEIWCGYKFLGVDMSNNQAEYYSIILGLQCARSLGIKRIVCMGDSELIIKQLTGKYKVKNAGLKKLWDATQTAIRDFDVCQMKHIVRADNERADKLANTAMDKKTSFGFEEVS